MVSRNETVSPYLQERTKPENYKNRASVSDSSPYVSSSLQQFAAHRFP